MFFNKLSKLLIILIIFFTLPLSSVFAACNFTTSPSASAVPLFSDITASIDVSGSSAFTGKWFVARANCPGSTAFYSQPVQESGGKVTVAINGCATSGQISTRTVDFYYTDSRAAADQFISTHGIGYTSPAVCSGSYTLVSNCSITIDPKNIQVGNPVSISYEFEAEGSATYLIDVSVPGGARQNITFYDASAITKAGTVHSTSYIPTGEGAYTVFISDTSSPTRRICSASFYATIDKPKDPGGKSKEPFTDSSTKICSSVPSNLQESCVSCFTNNGAWTAIGCISTSPTGSNGFVTVFLRFGVSIGGGIAFLLILWGGFQMITSTGNPEALNSARELIGAAVGGLLMIIFSLFLLRFIGVDILSLPGFG